MSQQEHWYSDPFWMWIIGMCVFSTVIIIIVINQTIIQEKWVNEGTIEIANLNCIELGKNILDGKYNNDYEEIKNIAINNWLVRCHGGLVT